MLDHVFITVKDLDRSIAFYTTALKPLGIEHALDFDGKDGFYGKMDENIRKELDKLTNPGAPAKKK